MSQKTYGNRCNCFAPEQGGAVCLWRRKTAAAVLLSIAAAVFYIKPLPLCAPLQSSIVFAARLPVGSHRDAKSIPNGVISVSCGDIPLKRKDRST